MRLRLPLCVFKVVLRKFKCVDVNKFFFFNSALFSLLNAMNDYVARIRPLRGRIRHVTTRGYSRVVTNMVSEHKILEMFFFRIDVSHATSSRVLFIGVSRDTSMSERL